MDIVVSVPWLAEHLEDKDVTVIDCRFVLGSPDKGREGYEEGHIPGAFYFDLEKDLSGPKSTHGGRHPWPHADDFAKKLGEIGVTPHTTVILYDEQKGMIAARAYCLLAYVGNQKIALLDGGFDAWKKAGKPITAEVPQPTPVVYSPVVQENLLCSVHEVQDALNMGESGPLLIDSRPFSRYTGENETVFPVGGHIPGAVNYGWWEVVDQNGIWKSETVLREHFAALPTDRELIVYCGSGLTACANLLALRRIGRANVRLYAGGWSDWISYPENKVAKGQ